jgi:CheY-specific phosphatase CheX
MALTAANLQKVAGADQQLWLYNTADAIATVVASGYFDSVTGNLKQNDVMIVVGVTGGTRTVDVITVSSATQAATVTTTALEGVTAS